jgi:hypothetical protein
MKNKDYTATIKTKATAKDAFQKIAKVGDWWAKHFMGKALTVGDTFTVRFGETRVDFKITEAIPDKKIIWYVTDCYLHWLKNKTEWTDTKVVWEISEESNSTQIKMTHIGLTPDVECYEDCKVGWTGHVTKSLVNLLNENKGQPE